MVSPLRPLAAALFASLAVLSCGGGNAASKLVQPPDYQPKDQTKCGVAKSQAKPLIVEWPSPDRLELENKVHQGLVIVHYVGCEMSVLDRCSVPAKYAYLGATRNQDKVEMKDEDSLYAHLPVGAAGLEATLERTGRLTVDMNLVGRFEADRAGVRADELQGDCAGATHFVYGVTVGAFDFYAGGGATVGASAGIGNVGAGGHSQAERETLTKAGDESACSKATLGDKAPPDGCGALIRIEVVPLGEAKQYTPTCPSGTQWDGAQSQCVGKKVVTDVQCPGGTTWNGSMCIGSAAPAPAAAMPAAPTPSPQPAPSGGSCPAGMASLPGGSFTMGDRKDNVTVQPFCLDTTEVTVAAYAACARGGQCTPAATTVDWPNISDADRTKWSAFCNGNRPDRSNHPVNCVDWGQSATYCHAQGKRLPTEEEWEWAARGGNRGGTYPWGNAAPDFQLCWSGMQKRDGTCAVGSFREGDAPGGIHDLAGNVWEWTSSNFDATGAARVIRGGSWDSGVASYIRAAYRVRYTPGNRNTDLGFRCAR
jgi:formylglycine-generating enzyme required for sulfatase activity